MWSMLKKGGKALILPAVVYGIFLVLDFGRFANTSSLYTIFLQSIIPTITAYAVAFGYICGIFDFTIGSRIIISGLVGGILSVKFGVAGLIIGCLVTGILLAMLTGILNWTLKMPSLVLTMGLTMIFEILGKNITGKFSFISINYDYAFLGASPYILVVLVVSAILFYFIYNHTRFSQHMQAVGTNELIAKSAGIGVDWVKFLSFALGGIFIGISALLTISQSGSMGAQVGLGSSALLFKPMMCVMIAMALRPLCNMTFGIFISQFTLNTIFIGLIALGIPDTFQDVVLGIFLLIVMVFSGEWQTIQQRLKRKKVVANH